MDGLAARLLLVALAGCAADDNGSTQDGGRDVTASDGSRDTGAKDASDAADASDAHPGVDPCTDCIILSCPNEVSACVADPACKFAWDLYEQCRQDGGTANCLFNFAQSSYGGDVISCAGKYCAGQNACP